MPIEPSPPPEELVGPRVALRRHREAAGLLEAALWDMGLHRVEIRCDPRNVRSAAVARRLGYAHEGTLREHLWFHDGWRDTAVFGKLRPT